MSRGKKLNEDFTPLDVFTYYFEHGMLRQQTLRHFNLSNGHCTAAQNNQSWAKLKSENIDDYNLAKQCWLHDIDADEECVLVRVNDLSQTAQSEQVRLQACKLLLDFAATSYRDENININGNKLLIEVVPNENQSDI